MICIDAEGRDVNVWRVPPFGHVADEVLPRWLLDRLIDRSFEITDIGGLLDKASGGIAMPGDDVLFYEDETILFSSNTTITS